MVIGRQFLIFESAVLSGFALWLVQDKLIMDFACQFICKNYIYIANLKNSEMKKIGQILIVMTAIFVTSCGKDIEESIVDCLGESAFVTLKHAADAADAKKINYTIEYSGSGTLKSVKWTFGDGKTETVNGPTVSHTYASAGAYNVQADATVAINKSNCTSTHKKGVTVD